MRIIFINRYFYPDYSATSQLLTDLAFSLAAQGFDIHVIASRQLYDNPHADLPAYEQLEGISIHRVSTTKFGRTGLKLRALDYVTFYLTATLKLAAITKRGDMVVCETDPPLISVLSAPICALKGARFVNWVQDVFPEVATALGIKWMNGLVGSSLRAIRNMSLQLAETNVVLGERMACYLRHQGIAEDKLKVIHNWSDGDAIRPLDSVSRFKREWGLEDKFVVSYSGNLGRAHDFETIVAAADKLRDVPDLVFLFIGDGHYRQWLEREVAARNLPNVRFQPYQEREVLNESLAVCDVSLVSLRPELEGFIVPSKFYGVAASGKPVIFIGDIQGEVAQIVTRENCGRAVDQGNVDQLAADIREFYSVPQTRESLGSNARKVFERRFERRLSINVWLESVILRVKIEQVTKRNPGPVAGTLGAVESIETY